MRLCSSAFWSTSADIRRCKYRLPRRLRSPRGGRAGEEMTRHSRPRHRLRTVETIMALFLPGVAAHRGRRPVLLLCFAWTSINGFVNIRSTEWEIGYYSDDVQQAILTFPPGLQARYIHLTERMLT